MEEDGTRPWVLGHLRLGAPGRGRSDLLRTPRHPSGVQAAGLAPGRSQSSVGARCRPEHPSEGWAPGPAHPSTSAPALGVGFAQRDPGGCGDRPRGAAVGRGLERGRGGRGIHVPPPPLPSARPRTVTLTCRSGSSPRPAPAPPRVPLSSGTRLRQTGGRTRGLRDQWAARRGAARGAGECPAWRPHPLWPWSHRGAERTEGGLPGPQFPQVAARRGALAWVCSPGRGARGIGREGPRRARGFSLGWWPQPGS